MLRVADEHVIFYRAEMEHLQHIFDISDLPAFT